MMMRQAITGAIASVALLSAFPVAAQDARENRPGANAPAPGPAPSARTQPPERSAPAARSQGEVNRPRLREAQPGPARERAAPERQTRQRQAEPPVRQRQAEPRHQPPKRAQNRDDSSRQRAEQRRLDRPKDQPRTTQGAQPSGEKQKGRAARDSTIRQDVKRIQASDEQRRSVRDRLFKERRVDRIKLDIRPVIGTHIPRRHRLHRLPVWIVDVAPIYRGYSYVVIEDTICIVDPETYVIVDVIPASTQRAERPQLYLTPEEMRFVYAQVPKDRQVRLNIRLALGAEIPRDVELRAFPEWVLERIPKLEVFRYVVTDDAVVIVDPADYSVVLVISD
jgi:uncharacterized protein DUF1236